ncbi:P pilus assembly protein, porin PapC [Terriglobus roseus DSM 18391]|uniref:P pilus assembly protein, porin PapC n=1 Tax=Terriglobus roseus (strain DSM 18391 / NRRL B-41598 / KBS 63) TaxID=926566 RepID=I3ZK17_TERRK|nr:fimbria/pilus outer membrane usher protein [Terriglobus roseus]AFL89585.1 P pilus assembly protein, porin PapC [Terriglobus roseus DSM 18391]
MIQTRSLRWLLGGLVLLMCLFSVDLCFGEEEYLLLEVYVDGRATHRILEFSQRDGTLLAHADDLREIGLQIPGLSNDWTDLHTLPRGVWRIDIPTQTLFLSTDGRITRASRLMIDRGTDTEMHRNVESSTGMTLNYDLLTTIAGSRSGLNGQANLRAFSPRGTLSSSWLGYAGGVPGPYGTNNAVRLDTTYQYADVDTMRRYSLGDFVTSGLTWTRPVHLTGFQLRSDFSTRPDLVTFPLPSVRGSAAVPSTINVLADGAQVLSQQIEPGPFQVPQLPVVMGAGNIALTVTNALGQQVTLTQRFYASSAMLAPKLQTFAFEAGAVRRDWGSISNHYGSAAAFANYRRGINSSFTFEGKVEAAPGALTPGVGGILRVGTLGTVTASASASFGNGHNGQQLSLGAERLGRVFSIGAYALITRRSYTDVAALNNAPLTRSQISGNVGYSTRHFGTFGAAYGAVNQASYYNASLSAQQQPQRTRILSANYSVQIHHVTVYANEFRSIGDGSNSQGFQGGISFAFGSRSSADISGTSDGTAQIAVRRPATSVGQWGYDAYVQTGSFNHQFAEFQHRSKMGFVTGGIDQTAGVMTGRAETQGAVSLVDRRLFASNEIFDSFAVVDTGAARHVKIFEENRPVGDTGRSGKLLIADVRSFQLNHLSIDATGVPIDATIENAAQTFRPRDLSGVIIRFNIRVNRSALVHITDADGVAEPVGSIATLRSTKAAVTVGYDGSAFVADLEPKNELDVVRPDGHRCSVSFTYKPIPGDIPVLGPFRCKEVVQ